MIPALILAIVVVSVAAGWHLHAWIIAPILASQDRSWRHLHAINERQRLEIESLRRREVLPGDEWKDGDL
jgi:hypothetical protein